MQNILRRSRATGVVISACAMLLTPMLNTTAVEAVPTWGPEEQVSSSMPIEEESVAVTVTRRGVAFAAWMQQVGDSTHIFGARRSRAGDWSDPKLISEGVSRYATWDLAAGPRSGASIVWHRRVSGTLQVEESHWSTGTWTSPVRIRAGNRPAVAIDSDGRTTVAWRREGVRVIDRPAGGDWGKGVRLASGNAAELELSSGTTGVTAAAWEKPTKVGSTLYSTVRPAGRAWRDAEVLMRGTDIESLRIEVGPAGRSLAVWSTANEWDDDAHTYRNGVAWSRSSRDGTWPEGRYLNRTIGEDGGSLALSMNSSGDALATWYSAGSGDVWTRIDTARFDAADGWDPPMVLARRWFEHRPWIDDSGRAHVLGARAVVKHFTQDGTSPWSSGTTVADGSLGDAAGAVDRLLLLTFGEDGIVARPLNVG